MLAVPVDKAAYKVRQSRRMKVVKPSKYEASKRLHEDREHWLSKIDRSERQTSLEMESEKLQAALPSKLFRAVCRVLELPPPPLPPTPPPPSPPPPTAADAPRRRTKEYTRIRKKICVTEPKITHRKSFKVERERESDTEVEISPRVRGAAGDASTHVHWEFLQRSVREQVTWPSRYLQPESEEEKSLLRRADDRTDQITEDFCEYMRQLGGDQTSPLFTEDAIKDLFQVEFDSRAARSLCVATSELGCVPDSVAAATRCPERSEKAYLQRQIELDIKAAASAGRVAAFGRRLPAHEQWRAPRSDARRLWRSAGHVPRDLVTLKAVWDGITNLRSVKEYCRWMIEHPEYRRAPYLKNMGMFDLKTLNARVTVESVHLNEDKAISTEPSTHSMKFGHGSSRPVDRLVTNLGEASGSFTDNDMAPVEEIRRRLSVLVAED